MGAQFTKAQWRRNLPEQSYNIHVLDASLGVRVIFRPQRDEFSKMVRTKNGPITGQIVKVVHDDGNEQVEDKEGAEDEEGDEVNVGKVGATASGGSSIIRLQ